MCNTCGCRGAEDFEAESERITVRDLEGNTYSLKRINEIQLKELMTFGDSRKVSDRMFFVDGSNGVAFPEGMRAWWYGGLDYDKPKTKVIDDEGNKYDMWERYLMEEANDDEPFEDTNVYMNYLIPFFRDENDEPYSREERERRGFMFRAESKFDELSDEIAEQYEKKGMSKEEAEKIGKATAYKVGVAKYGKRGMERKAKAGMKKKKMKAEDFNTEERPYGKTFLVKRPYHVARVRKENIGGGRFGLEQWNKPNMHTDANMRGIMYDENKGWVNMDDEARRLFEETKAVQLNDAEDLSVKESAKIGFGFGAGILGFQIALLAGATLVGAFMGRGE